ncbi:MAG: hypothetical protein QW051_00375 [Candidatus Aenigmatarchaeota archaeon]
MLWWLLSKIIGVLMVLAGIFLIIFFPGIEEHQESAGGESSNPTSFAISGIVIGLVLLIAGIFIIFAP